MINASAVGLAFVVLGLIVTGFLALISLYGIMKPEHGSIDADDTWAFLFYAAVFSGLLWYMLSN